jgi:hypothetical protein
MPKILFVYFTYSQQTLVVVDAMAERLIEQGCEIRKARIELTEPRHAARFSFSRCATLASSKGAGS